MYIMCIHMSVFCFSWSYNYIDEHKMMKVSLLPVIYEFTSVVDLNGGTFCMIRCSNTWAKIVALFGKIMEHVGGWASLEEMDDWDQPYFLFIFCFLCSGAMWPSKFLSLLPCISYLLSWFPHYDKLYLPEILSPTFSLIYFFQDTQWQICYYKPQNIYCLK